VHKRTVKAVCIKFIHIALKRCKSKHYASCQCDIEGFAQTM